MKKYYFLYTLFSSLVLSLTAIVIYADEPSPISENVPIIQTSLNSIVSELSSNPPPELNTSENTQNSTRQIKSSEEIIAENAHLQDALSPLVWEAKALELEEIEDTSEDIIINEPISSALSTSVEPEIVYTTRTTPISIEHEGSDDLGIRFALRMKNELNQSSLFTLEEGIGRPKLTLMLSTVSEFKDRPAMGSAYALVWIFVYDSITLKYYLDQEVGVFTADEIDGLVAKILDRADGFAVLYDYLFE